MPTAIAKPDIEALILPSDVVLLDDNDQFTNRFDFVSDSGKQYRIAQRIAGKNARSWSCSCPGWIYNRNGKRECKHLRDFGIPGGLRPFEVGRLALAGATGTLPAAAPALPAPAKSAKAAGRKRGKALPAPKKTAAKAALPAPAPSAIKGLKPEKVDLVNGKIVITFSGEDQAAVFALLAQLS